MLNHIVIMGRLTRDPELRYTQSNTPVCSFTLAVDRDFERDKVDFIDCVAWRGTGEFVSRYFLKGQMAVVSGALQLREWTDRNGGKRTSAEINAEHVYFGEPKRREDSAPRMNDMPAGSGDGNPFTGGVQQNMEGGDGELPF